MKKILLLIALLAGLGLVLGGCSSSTESTDPNTGDFEDFGPYTATDEESADFGDEYLNELLAETEEEEYEDPVALSPLVDSVENLSHPDIFCFRMVWGNLPRDSGVTELTDWSGTLTMSRGAVVVTHLIKFEPGQDYLLPRYDEYGVYHPEILQWVSQTSWHIDGLATKLFIPPSITDEIVTVTYESDHLSITFTMDQLQDLDTLIDIGVGNAISFQSMRCEPRVDRPLRGYLRGHWCRDENGQGIFYGRWMANNGRLVGALKGNWGVDSTGTRMFVGKWVDRSGRFQGFVKGDWEPTVCNCLLSDCHNGVFEGRIFNADRDPIGMLRGHYTAGGCRPGGYFAGRWCVASGCRNSGQ